MQLGLFDRAPSVVGLLLPPSVGGTASANDNAAPAPQGPLEAAPELTGSLEAGPLEVVGGALELAPASEAGDDDEGPATVRDLAPWGAAGAATAGWYTLEEAAERVV